jgi:hypothetical protein
MVIWVFWWCSALGLFGPLLVRGQVAIANVQGTVDTLVQRVELRYDLISADSAATTFEVELLVSTDNGLSFEQVRAGLAGAVGPGQAPGLAKTLSWNYQTGSSGLVVRSPRALFRVVATDSRPVDIAALVAQVDSIRLRALVTEWQGIRHRSTNLPGLERARTRLDSALLANNLILKALPFDYEGFEGRNITGERTGVATSQEVVLVGAHYDTVNISPGADDNTTGLVALLEISRILAPFTTRRTLRFIGFDLEEYGLQGSTHYVSTAIPPHETLVGLLNFDMIGYADARPNSQKVPQPVEPFKALFPQFYDSLANNEFRGDFIMNVADQTPGSGRLMALVDSCARVYVPGLRMYSGQVPASLAPLLMRNDCGPFWIAGLPAILLNDGGAEYRNPHYHRASDTIGTLNFTFFQRVVQAALAATAQLVGLAPSASATASELTLNWALTHRSDLEPSLGHYVRLVAYPNPASDHTQLRAWGASGGPGIVEVSDMLARKVYTVQWPDLTRPLNLPTSSWPAGLYYICLSDAAQPLGECKLIIR